MRRWVIALALLANALASGLILLAFWYDAGWGEAPRAAPEPAPGPQLTMDLKESKLRLPIVGGPSTFTNAFDWDE